MRVVVTGGAGFIGANLVGELLVGGATAVTVIDDLSTGRLANLQDLDVHVEIGSILDAALLDRVLPGADAIVHMAARPSVPRSLEDPLASHTVNATGTLHVLEAARRAGRPYTIVASSSSVYGANPTLPKHEGLPPQPMSPYAASKLATEAYALAYAGCFDLPVLALRFFNVFGPLQPADHSYAAVIPAFVSAALEDRPLPIHGDGLQTRDFTYVGSVTALIADALRRRVSSPTPVNLAFGTRRSLRDVVDALQREVGHPLELAFGPPRPGDVRHSQADQTNLRALFPDVEPVAFEDGLAATVAWGRTRPATPFAWTQTTEEILGEATLDTRR
ncbi:MAG TPA: NAD-dependent epimerase/dehydratase family protein [Nitriliruptorales bacterium]|nr:NAD-dependent epimerase/dehydratase family protein [Nitriliruptorales bacterium]